MKRLGGPRCGAMPGALGVGVVRVRLHCGVSVVRDVVGQVAARVVGVLEAVFGLVRRGVVAVLGPLFEVLGRAPLWVRELALIYVVWWCVLAAAWFWVKTLLVLVHGGTR